MPADPPQHKARVASRDRLWLNAADGDLVGRRISAWLAMHRVQASHLAQEADTNLFGLSRALHGKRPFPVILALRISQYTGLPINGDTVTYDPARAQHARPEPGPPANPAACHDGGPPAGSE
jgi:hypothetical protein